MTTVSRASRTLIEIEKKWKGIWKELQPFHTPHTPDTLNTPNTLNAFYPINSHLPKQYVLAMFPYPSGALHMGHARVYTISDVLARYYRMRGHFVIHPMGWDAFGLPAENAARDRNIPAAQWTQQNIQQMKQQLDSLGFLFDWHRKIVTCDPEYYRWTQWIFLRLYKRRLAYRQEGLVNWDPVDQTVLANEQVDAQGRSWRSGAIVERRPLIQWYLRITAFQKELVTDLMELKWPMAVKEMQRNWIIDREGEEGAKGDVPIYRLHDWLISRQRQWGTPIPIIHCSVCGIVPVPEDQLPVLHPTIEARDSPVTCPQCKSQDARRESDTMDTFMDSSWYYWRHLDPHNNTLLCSPEALQNGMPVDVYIGGIEHAIMHLLYARFIHRFLRDEMSEMNDSISLDPEPFRRLITHGLVEGKTRRCPDTGRFLRPEEITISNNGKEMIEMVRSTGKPVAIEWAKMSKSKFNGVDPVELIDAYGADVLRLCVIFKAPPEMNLRWNTRDIKGPQRWLMRLVNLTEKVLTFTSIDRQDETLQSSELTLINLVNRAVREMEAALDVNGPFKLNLTVSTLMKFSNELEQFVNSRQVCNESIMKALYCLFQLLHPLAPHTSAELLSRLSTRYPSPQQRVVFSWPVQLNQSQIATCL